MIKCPECESLNLEDSKTCSDCGLDLIDAFNYMPVEDRQKLYVKGPPPKQEIKLNPQPVTIKDFDMPFGSMIVFMLKWALASIPAMIILAALVGLVFALITGALTGMSME